MDYRFIVEDEDGQRNVVPVSAGVLHVGRQADNEICLPERNVSRRHARLSLEADGSCTLEDLNSYNGVFVNGQRIEQKGRMGPGDTLRIGDFQLELRGGSTAASLTHTDKIHLFSEEGTQPAGQSDAARALANEPTVPGLADDASTERTDVSVRLQAEPTHPGAHEDAPGAGREVTDRLAVGGSDAQRLESTQLLERRGLEPPYAHLLCLSGERAGTPFALGKPRLVIGRTEDRDIALNHRSISREHSSIEWSQGSFRIADLDSSNGTLVNGESVQQVALRAGDVVELGEIRLRFVPAGEPCVLTADERAAVARELEGPRRLSGKRWPQVAAVMAVTCFATAGVMWWSTHQATPAAGPTPAAPPAGVAAAPVADEAQSLTTQAQTALAAKNYARAQALATAALAIDESRHDAVLIAQKAGAEERAQKSLEAARRAADEQAWADAFNALQEIPAGGSHHAEAQALMAEVKPALLRERIDEARAAMASHDYDEVAVLLDEAEALEPEPATLAELRRALDAARRHADGKKPVRPHVAPPPAPPPHAAPAHRPAAAPGRSARPAASPVRLSEEAMAAARANYSDGTRWLAANQTQRAIESFGRCLAADKTFGMCYRALGIAYAKAGNGPKAVHFYRLYLKVEPGARDAPQVRALLQQYNQQAGGGGEASR